MRRLAVKVCVAGALLMGTAARAESPYVVSVKGDVTAVRSLASDLHDGLVARMATPVRSQDLIRLSFAAPGIGRVNLVLNDVSYKSWNAYTEDSLGSRLDPKDVILVGGFMKGRDGKKKPVGGSLYSSKGHPTLHLVVHGERKRRSSYISIRLDGAQRVPSGRISALPDSALSKLACGDSVHPSGAPVSRGSIVGTTGLTSGTATVATDADPEYFAAYGSETNAHIATLISAASAIYQNQLGIRINVGTQHVFTSSSGNPYTSTDANQLLTQFQEYTRTNAHLGTATAYHLFSGKDFNGGTIGLAYVGVVCEYNDYVYGTTQKYHPSADSSIFAHELGHNFGANHAADSSSIMAAYVNVPGSTYFSSESITQIQNHLSSADTCLAQGGGGDSPGLDPTPTPEPDPSVPATTVRATVSRRGILDIRMNVDLVRSDCLVQLYGAGSAGGDGRLLTQFTATSTQTRTVLSGLKDPRPSTRSTLFFWTTHVCPEGTVESSVKSVNLNVVSAKTSQSTGRIIQAIGRALSTEGTSRRRRIG